MNCLIAIPTYYGNQLAVNCISSILKNVPNADIRLYKNDVGWLQAANLLISEAAALNRDILLLNDDTFVLCDIVKELQEVAYSDPKIGIVGGKSLSIDQETVINYGIYIAPDGNTAHKHFGQRKNEITEIENQRAVEGSCFYIKREVVETIGLFDENFGSGYREEVDYSFRAKEAGYKIVSAPKAEYVHLVNQTHGRLNIQNDTYEYFMSKWGTKLKLGEI